MTSYRAPVQEMRFAMDLAAALDTDAAVPDPASDLTAVGEVLDHAARFGAEVLAPLNAVGDRQGCRIENGRVRTPDGFADAYRQFADSEWNGIAFDTGVGGQGLSYLAGVAVAEIWCAANLSFALCPALSRSGARLLERFGTPWQRRIVLPKLVSGAWSATMNMTEPQAGSDLSGIRVRAERRDDHYRISGQKVFISFGDHDLTANIVHLVLARLPDAPPGVGGISLFLVPKFLIGQDGTLGDQNDVSCVSLERKLGLHGAPTAVMAYGERTGQGAIGHLVGEENGGLQAMFTMMNAARLNVGLEGVALADRAFQHARSYARERVQGRRGSGGEAAIIDHPDVQRMLYAMKARSEASRALTYFTAAQVDVVARHPDPDRRASAQSLVDLLTPVVKAWCSDTAIDVANTGIQVLGGMGYIEDSEAPQFLRDARVTAIYEGTNGIQARDLAGRKVRRDDGATARALMATMRADCPSRSAVPLSAAIDCLDRATGWLLSCPGDDHVLAAATPYLRLMGTVVGGWLMNRGAAAARRALGAGDREPDFLVAKADTARFYNANILPEADFLHAAATTGAEALLDGNARTL